MKACQVVRQQVDISLIRLSVDLHDEEDMPQDFPGRSGNTWTVLVCPDNGDLYLGRGKPFPPDATLDLQMKVCDCGAYELLGHDGEVVKSIDGGYVPGCFPGDHYGDYIIFDIAGGKVQNWDPPSSEELSESFGLLGEE